MKEDIANLGENICELGEWLRIYNCLISNVNGEQQYTVDEGLAVDKASFNECMVKFIDLLKKLTNNWAAIAKNETL